MQGSADPADIAAAVPDGGRIALTGASGFIGRHLLDRLLAEGLQVRALWRGEGAPQRPRLEICRGSLATPECLAGLVRDCHGVVHLAGATRGRNRARFYAVNLAGTRRLVGAVASHAPAARAVATSSLAAREPQLSWYAASKAAAEQELVQAPQAWAVLRPPAVYGPGDPALAPLWQALARGWLPRVGLRTGRFSLLHVDELCEAILRLLRHPTPVRGLLPLHDGRPGGYSWSDIAAIGARCRGAPVRIVPIPRHLLAAVAALNLGIARLRTTQPMLTPGKARELFHPDWVCDNSLLHDALGWSPGTVLEANLPRLHGWKSSG